MVTQTVATEKMTVSKNVAGNDNLSQTQKTDLPPPFLLLFFPIVCNIRPKLAIDRSRNVCKDSDIIAENLQNDGISDVASLSTQNVQIPATDKNETSLEQESVSIISTERQVDIFESAFIGCNGNVSTGTSTYANENSNSIMTEDFLQESDCDSSFALNESLDICINTMDEMELLSDDKVEIVPLQHTSTPCNTRSPI